MSFSQNKHTKTKKKKKHKNTFAQVTVLRKVYYLLVKSSRAT